MRIERRRTSNPDARALFHARRRALLSREAHVVQVDLHVVPTGLDVEDAEPVEHGTEGTVRRIEVHRMGLVVERNINLPAPPLPRPDDSATTTYGPTHQVE